MSVLIDCSLTNFHELSKFWRPSGGLRVSDMQERETERKGLLFGHRNRWEEWRGKEGQRGGSCPGFLWLSLENASVIHCIKGFMIHRQVGSK